MSNSASALASPRPAGVVDLLALSFGSVAGMWTAWYFTHLPGAVAPMWLSIGLLLAALFAGAYLGGKLTLRGWKAGASIGLLSWLINLLVLLSLISGDQPGRIVPKAGLWLATSLGISLVVAIAGAVVGTTRRDSRKPLPNWPGVLCAVSALATLLLLLAGGLVTSADAGMAVPDWPSSFGYNMFLFPLARMTEGIYFEHAHRLFGALVGLVTLTTAICLQASSLRSTLKVMGWIALLLVIVQGVLGGVRVELDKTTLAFIHGILGQIFFAYLIALTTLASQAFERLCENPANGSSPADRGLTKVLVAGLLLQLCLGAMVRHFHSEKFEHMIMGHITMGIVVLGLVIAAGVNAWGKYPQITLLRRTGMGLIHATSAQLILGFVALASGVLSAPVGQASSWQLIIATLHQGVGALVLAWSVRLAVLQHRPLAPRKQPAVQQA